MILASIMSFYTPNLLLRSTRSHDVLQQKSSRQAETNNKALNSRSSLANLIQFARNPLENIGEAVEDWYDGSTREERTRRQVVEDRKQLLYLKMRTVSECHT